MIYSVRFRLFNVADRPAFKPEKCKSRRRSIMNSINPNNKIKICCIVFLCTLGAHAAPLPSTPDNAALLYYQAFLLVPEYDVKLIHPVLNGADPNQSVRDHVENYREAIELADTATKIPNCNWGIMRSQLGRSSANVIGPLRQLTFLLELDARILTDDGDYLPALERALSIRRLAQHFTDEATVGYLTSIGIHNRAYLSICHTLGSMSTDAEMLTWLQGQISSVQGPPPSPAGAMETTLKDNVEFLSTHPDVIATWRENAMELIEDENTRQEIINLTDEELIALAEQSINSFLASINRIIGSDMLYRQKQLELQALVDELTNYVADAPVRMISFHLSPADVVRQHSLYVGSIAHFNATRTAIEVYLINANTGQLPDTLPADMPKDPFTGNDFEYEITDEGFTLSFDPENFSELRNRQLEFKVKTKN
jgi:hypothetical protein